MPGHLTQPKRQKQRKCKFTGGGIEAGTEELEPPDSLAVNSHSQQVTAAYSYASDERTQLDLTQIEYPASTSTPTESDEFNTSIPDSHMDSLRSPDSSMLVTGSESRLRQGGWGSKLLIGQIQSQTLTEHIRH